MQVPEEMKPFVSEGDDFETSEIMNKKNRKTYEKFNYHIPGLCKKDVDHFLRIHRKNNIRSDRQTFRVLLYK